MQPGYRFRPVVFRPCFTTGLAFFILIFLPYIACNICSCFFDYKLLYHRGAPLIKGVT